MRFAPDRAAATKRESMNFYCAFREGRARRAIRELAAAVACVRFGVRGSVCDAERLKLRLRAAHAGQGGAGARWKRNHVAPGGPRLKLGR